MENQNQPSTSNDIMFDQPSGQGGQSSGAPGDIMFDQPKAPTTPSPFTMNDNDSFLTKAGKAVGGTVMGVGEGVASTGAGLTDLLGGKNTTLSHELHFLASENPGQETSGSEKVGQGIETIAEFLMGDEALKGLSMADKLKNVSGLMKFIEKSPKLEQALHLGINVGKAGAELSPEERALLQEHPILARLAGHGLAAIRQGVTQTGQTLVKTGGNVGEALKSGATMGATSAALGVPLGVAGGLLAKGGEAAETAQNLAGQAAGGSTETEVNQQLGNTVQNTLQPTIDTAQAAKEEAEGRIANAAQSPADIAANAPGHEAITAAAQKAAKAGYESLGNEFEKGRNILTNATKGQELTYENSPLQQAAKDLLGQGKAAEHPLDEAFNQTRPGSDYANTKLQKLIDPYGENELQDAAKEIGPDGTPTKKATQAQTELADIAQQKAEKPITMDMKQLLDRRKLLNEDLRSTGWATDEQRADRDIFHKLIGGIDDSIEQLTNQSGNPEAIDALGKMNADYKAGITRFQNPDVKSLLQGNSNDIMKRIMGGATSVADINTVRDAIGKDAFSKLADSSVQQMAADAIDKTTGQFNFKTFFNNWTRIPPQTRAAMFQGSLQGGAVENAIKQAQMVNASGVIPEAETTIKDTTKTISDLLGNGNVTSLLKDPARVQQISQLVGPDAMGELGTSVLQNQLREAATNGAGKTGSVDTGKMLNFISSLKDSPEVVESLFRPTPERAAAYDKLIKDVQNVQGVKNLVKFGIITPALGAIGGAAVGHAALPAILGALAADTGAGFGMAKDLLDKIANSPATWSTLKAANKAAQSSTAAGVTAVSKAAAGKTANALRQAINSSGSSLQ